MTHSVMPVFCKLGYVSQKGKRKHHEERTNSFRAAQVQSYMVNVKGRIRHVPAHIG